MSYTTAGTTWPTWVNGSVRSLIARFYELADSQKVDAGSRLANETFSPSALMITPGGTFQGHEGQSNATVAYKC